MPRMISSIGLLSSTVTFGGCSFLGPYLVVYFWELERYLHCIWTGPRASEGTTCTFCLATAPGRTDDRMRRIIHYILIDKYIIYVYLCSSTTYTPLRFFHPPCLCSVRTARPSTTRILWSTCTTQKLKQMLTVKDPLFLRCQLDFNLVGVPSLSSVVASDIQ